MVVVHVQLKGVKKWVLKKEPTSETHCEQRILVLIETQSKSVYGIVHVQLKTIQKLNSL